MLLRKGATTLALFMYFLVKYTSPHREGCARLAPPSAKC